jgi:hypothetical protein
VGKWVTTIGWLVTGKTAYTQDGDPMKLVSFEDITGLYETVFFLCSANQKGDSYHLIKMSACT